MNSRSPAAIVVGAGIIGASIAWRLVQRGVTVAVFDARGLGEEASWAGAGMLACGGEITQRDIWGSLALDGAEAYPEFVRELREETGLAIDYRACGALELARGEGEWAALADRAALQAGLGIASEQIGPAAAAVMVPGLSRDALTAAVYYPGDAIVNPRDVMAALHSALLRRNVAIHEREPVAEIRARGESVEVLTTRGTYRTDAAVLAAGAWSSRIPVLVDGIACTLFEAVPVRGHLVSWSLPPSTLGPIVRHGHTYLFQRSSGAAIAGTSHERAGFDRTLDRSTVNDIVSRARAVLPALFGAEPSDAWNGFRPGTATGLPVIGRMGETRLWQAYGHYRNGILMAPATAGWIAREISAS